MPRDMKPIGPGRLDALKGMVGGAGPEAPSPEGGKDYQDTVDIPGMIDALEMDALPTADGEKRAHLEKAIAELKMCVGDENEPQMDMAAKEEPETPAA